MSKFGASEAIAVGITANTSVLVPICANVLAEPGFVCSCKYLITNAAECCKRAAAGALGLLVEQQRGLRAKGKAAAAAVAMHLDSGRGTPFINKLNTDYPESFNQCDVQGTRVRWCWKCSGRGAV